MRRVVVPDLPGLGPLVLSPEESHHLLRVLRLPRGAELALSDGQGREAEAVLVVYDARNGRSSPMSAAFKGAIAEFEGLG